MTTTGKGVPCSRSFQHVPTPGWIYNLQRLSEGAGGLFLPTRPHLGVTPSTTEDKPESKEAKGEHFYDECAELLRLLSRLKRCPEEIGDQSQLCLMHPRAII